MVKTALVFILSSILYLLFSVPSTFAQNSLPTNTNPEVPNNLHNWTQTVMIEVMSALSCQISGIDPMNPKGTCLGIDQKTGKIGFLPKGDLEKGQVGGAIGGMGNMISVLFTPPIHTSDYFQHLASNFGVVKKTYAQTGTGFEGLKPLLNVWIGFRNVVYLFFVLVFVVIGLAIMLRIKIDPRTVMTIQNQIPKIIIGILLVTFSYAIAGFLIDMMYLSTHIVGNLIVDSGGLDKSLPTQLSQKTNPFSAVAETGAGGGFAPGGWWNIVYSPAKAIAEIITNNFFDPILNALPEFFTRGFKAASEGGPWWSPLRWPGIKQIVGFTIDAIFEVPVRFTHVFFGSIFGLLAYIIISIALLIALFRLWFTLLFAYVHILIDVILAPFWIIGGLIPGSPVNVGGWFRDIIANLAAFPAAIAMFLLGILFIKAFDNLPPTAFVPPLIGARATPEEIGSLIGLGIILMTPNVVNMLKAALKAPKVDTGSALAPLMAGGTVLGGSAKSTVGMGVTYVAGDPLHREKGIKGIGYYLQRRLLGG